MTAADKRPGFGLMIGGGLLLAWVALSYPLEQVQVSQVMMSLHSRDAETGTVVERSITLVNYWYRIPLTALGIALIAVGLIRHVSGDSKDD